ncbi:carboxylate-amine ligase [Microbacterium sp. NPDC055683]
MRTFGVEEELLLLDATTGEPRPLAPEILAGSTQGDGFELTSEMEQEMIEVVSAPSADVDELRARILAGRRAADDRARDLGARAVALATSPVPARPHPSVSPRYGAILERFRVLAEATLECGLHVHVSIESADEGVAILNRIRSWVPVILALSANSPFRGGEDTGYASFRHILWHQWPTAGPLELFDTAADYEAVIDGLLGAGGILDDAQIYFDARLSRHHPTVEVRVADVCLDPEDTVTIAALIRGLVDSAAADWRAGEPPSRLPSPVIRLGSWMAARWGVRGDLSHPETGRAVPAADAVNALVERSRPGLRRHGDLETVRDGVRAILERGTGAERQRARYELTGALAGAALGASTD